MTSRSALAFIASIVLATSCAAKDPEPPRATLPPAVITGEVTYLERIALLPGAELRVRLLDVLESTPAVVVAERTLRPTGNVPIRFELPFNPRRIDPSHTYAVDARLTSGHREWITIEQHAVLTNGAPSTVSIVLH